MTAIPIHDYGDAGQLRDEDAPISEIAPDEVLLIKCRDRESAPARYALHTAFLDPAVPGDAPPHQSIRMRVFLFHGQGLDG